MADLEISAMRDHVWSVKVTEGTSVTTHLVTVSDSHLAPLGLTGVDKIRLLRASFEFLLAREPASSILREFELPVIARYFPEYPAEMVAKLVT